MLKRKMFRDIRKNLSQFITIFLMVMIGIMAYSGIEAYMDGMKKTSNKFYSENRVLDQENNSIRTSWLALTSLVLKVNLCLLDVLGIKCPDKM